MERRVYGLTFDDLDERYFERDPESGRVVVRLAGVMEIRDEGVAARLDGETLVETQASPVSAKSAVTPSEVRTMTTQIADQKALIREMNTTIALLNARVTELEDA